MTARLNPLRLTLQRTAQNGMTPPAGKCSRHLPFIGAPHCSNCMWQTKCIFQEGYHVFKVVSNSNYQSPGFSAGAGRSPGSCKWEKLSSIERLEKGGQRDYEGNLAHSLSRVIKQPVTAPHIPLPLAEIRTAAAKAAGAALS